VAALVNAKINLRIAENAGNFLTSWQSVSFCRTLRHGVSKYEKCFVQNL